MKTGITDPLGEAKPVQFGRIQWSVAELISQRNNSVGKAALARIGLNMLIRATELNKGAVPLVEQITVRQLHRALARRAKRDGATAKRRRR